MPDAVSTWVAPGMKPANALDAANTDEMASAENFIAFPFEMK
jgi:hypothetical protein